MAQGFANSDRAMGATAAPADDDEFSIERRFSPSLTQSNYARMVADLTHEASGCGVMGRRGDLLVRVVCCATEEQCNPLSFGELGNGPLLDEAGES